MKTDVTILDKGITLKATRGHRLSTMYLLGDWKNNFPVH